jgi:hypothetical protein
VKSAEESLVASFQQIAYEIGGSAEDDTMPAAGGLDAKPNGKV